MSFKTFEYWISEGIFIAVELLAVRGEIVEFVVRLMRHEDDAVWCVARYDTAHGKPHLDIVDRRGRVVYKEWLLNMSFEQALQYAIVDFKNNHEKYIPKTGK